MSTTQRQLESALLDAVLNYINSRGWTNHDRFAEKLVKTLSRQIETGNLDLDRAVSKSKQIFFRLNEITHQSFTSGGINESISDIADSYQPKKERPIEPEAPRPGEPQTIETPASPRLKVRKQILGTLAFTGLLALTAILLDDGFVKLTDISAALAAVLVSGLAGALLYGYTDWLERLFGISKR